MKILKLSAENIMKLVAVEITPEGNVVVLTGKNGAGKTSVLNAITMALCGGRNVPEVPIRKGADKGGICLEFDDFTVIKNFTSKGAYLKIETKGGHTVNSPQAFLDELIGNLSFDPRDFIDKAAKDQKNILMEMLGLEDQLNQIDEQVAETYEDRTIIGRDVTRLEGQVAQFTEDFTDVPDKPVDIQGKIDELQKARNVQAEVEHQRLIKENLWQRRKEIECTIAMREEEVAEAKAELDNKLADLDKADAAIAEATNRALEFDIPAMRKALDNANEVNNTVRRKKASVAIEESLILAVTQQGELTAEIEDLRNSKGEILKAAKMPIKGLALDDVGVTYKGVPLNQISDGEKLRVGVAIGMALNPKIRIIRIQNGSLLDSENMKIIEEMAKANDFQVWIEKVDETGKVGIVIEEGRVIANGA